MWAEHTPQPLFKWRNSFFTVHNRSCQSELPIADVDWDIRHYLWQVKYWRGCNWLSGLLLGGGGPKLSVHAYCFVFLS
jgi:hypothetical protein